MFFRNFRVANATEDRAPYGPPIWTGPSQYEIPVLLATGDIVYGDDIAMVFDAVRVYTNGFELLFHVACRRPVGEVGVDRATPPWSARAGPAGLRIGFESSDGRCAGEEPLDLVSVVKDSDGLPYIPVTILEGRLTGSHRFDLVAWCWPLPPTGPLTVYVQWLDRGIPESSRQLSGDAVLNAAAAVQRVW